MKIAGFCSANNAIAPDFFTHTAQLGRWMGEAGHTLVFGGCNQGLHGVCGAGRPRGWRTHHRRGAKGH